MAWQPALRSPTASATPPSLQAVVSTIAVPDLLYQGTLITADTYRPLEVYTAIALIYFMLLFPATLLARFIERRINLHR
jgi:polar amino acid transport system permease protein